MGCRSKTTTTVQLQCIRPVNLAVPQRDWKLWPCDRGCESTLQPHQCHRSWQHPDFFKRCLLRAGQPTLLFTHPAGLFIFSHTQANPHAHKQTRTHNRYVCNALVSSPLQICLMEIHQRDLIHWTQVTQPGHMILMDRFSHFVMGGGGCGCRGGGDGCNLLFPLERFCVVPEWEWES